jgi:hypothetical protein
MKGILILFFSFITVASASENLKAIGKVIYNESNHSYYFIHLLSNEKISAHKIKLVHKSDLEDIKKLVGKSVNLEGVIDWKRGHNDSFSLTEELHIIKLNELDLKVLAFDSNYLIKQDNLISHYREPKNNQSGGMITLPDSVTNSVLSTSAIAIGVAAGPISLIPATVFGLYQLFL